MKILAIESSGMSAGCAYLEDGKLVSEYYMNSRLTHSVTLLPMISEMMKAAGFELKDLDAIAVSAGPGSFTGLRIGAATAKGLALAFELPIVPVSSLEGLAENCFAPGSLICPMMDARRGQVYAAMYLADRNGSGNLKNVLPERALSAEEFLSEVKELLGRKKVIFTGDGVPVHEALILEKIGKQAVFAPTGLNRQRASSVAILGAEALKEGKKVSCDDFVPDYIRRPLAETSKEDGSLEDAGVHSLKKISKGDFKRTKHPIVAENGNGTH